MPDSSFPDRPPFFAQESPQTCAVACLRMVLAAHGKLLDESDLAQRAQTNEFGTEMGNLVIAAQSLGFDCEAGILDLGRLAQARFPIVYLDRPTLGRAFMMHAVVVAEQTESVKVLDPSQGEVDLPQDLFDTAWQMAGGYAVVVRPRTGN